jgi:uncharacterized membrane protein YagU involved in acid resistance
MRFNYEGKPMRNDQGSAKIQGGQAWMRNALAGFIATVPMTLFMLGTQRFLPKGQQYELPPELLTKELAHRAHFRSHLSKQQIVALSLVSHFGYGASVGSLYCFLEKRPNFPAPVKGTLFGLLVWLVSYLGLAPLIGFAESGQTEPVRRNLMMIAAHVIWGSALGMTATRLVERKGE